MLRPGLCCWRYSRPQLHSLPLGIPVQHRSFSPSNLSRAKTRWSKDEIDILMQWNRGPEDELLALLPGRTLLAVRGKWRLVAPRNENGELKNMHPKFFKPKDFSKLAELVESGIPYPQIVKSHFPTRKPNDLSDMYTRYIREGLPEHIHRRRWDQTETERAIYLRDVEGRDDGQIAAMLGRRIDAVRLKFDRMRPKGGKTLVKYSQEEDAAIIKVSKEKGSPQDFEAALPHRSLSSIKGRKQRLLEKLDIPQRRSTLQSASMYRSVTDMKQQGLDRGAIAEHLGVSPEVVSSVLWRGKHRNTKTSPAAKST